MYVIINALWPDATIYHWKPGGNLAITKTVAPDETMLLIFMSWEYSADILFEISIFLQEN